MSNLVEAMQKEMNRLRELKKEYDLIPTGFMGGAVIQGCIDSSEKSIASGDVVQMLVDYEEMKKCTG